MNIARSLRRIAGWTAPLLGGVLLFLAPLRIGAKENPKVICTVAQLTQALSTNESDDQLAAQIAGLELNERLSTDALQRLREHMPGEKSKQALTMLADASSFLEPPDTEIDNRTTPDAAATRQMLVLLVSYVNTTLRQLPNFLVTKHATRFEDRPQEDALEATGTVSYSFQPLHYVGQSQEVLTYRNHGEVVDETLGQSMKQNQKSAGMATSGEFGSVLITVVADALKGRITWARWEKSPARTLAVFRFGVPEDKSNYRVKFCCIVEGFSSAGIPDQRLYDERVPYHGEIAFDPDTGTIVRMMLQAEMPPRGLVSNAGIVVEYGPEEIGGKSYVCPQRSVSLLLAHTAQQSNAQSRSNYKGPVKTYLNDVTFDSYRRFGAEVRILPASQ
ncbi:MAG: hypothetical protein P4L40_22255 [Terracidiphilus sp.]|nr:hypothetical protein [Terracidiphilus sp.]